MIIGIDDRTTKNEYKNRGIGNYTRHMINWLPRVDSTIRIETKDFRDVDVFLQPNFFDGLPKILAPKIIMMHDITPLATNHFTERGAIINFVKRFRYLKCLKVLQVADALMVNSEWTKRDLVKFLQVPTEKINVAYLGIDQEFFAGEPLNRQNRKPYILFVGGVEANKNFIRLLEAFVKVKQEFPLLQLAVPGSQFLEVNKVETKKIYREVKKLKISESVRFLGHVGTPHLIDLYRQTLVFVYPSCYEGFGFPVVEAMACGTPVVTSNVSSLPEVAGEVGFLVNPFDYSKIAEGIISVLHLNENDYADVSQKSRKQAAKFSWEKCASKTLAVAKNLVKS